VLDLIAISRNLQLNCDRRQTFYSVASKQQQSSVINRSNPHLDPDPTLAKQNPESVAMVV